jgi:hypothetical protein
VYHPKNPNKTNTKPNQKQNNCPNPTPNAPRGGGGVTRITTNVQKGKYKTKKENIPKE